MTPIAKIYDLEIYTSMFKLKENPFNVCLTVGGGNRAESVFCKTYTISGLGGSEWQIKHSN